MEGNWLCEQVHCLNPFLIPHILHIKPDKYKQSWLTAELTNHISFVKMGEIDCLSSVISNTKQLNHLSVPLLRFS